MNQVGTAPFAERLLASNSTMQPTSRALALTMSMSVALVFSTNTVTLKAAIERLLCRNRSIWCGCNYPCASNRSSHAEPETCRRKAGRAHRAVKIAADGGEECGVQHQHRERPIADEKFGLPCPIGKQFDPVESQRRTQAAAYLPATPASLSADGNFTADRAGFWRSGNRGY